MSETVLVTGGLGKIKLLTVSHSPVGMALESGLLDEAEAMHHEERHIVSNVVGSAGMRIEIGAKRKLAPRDTVLLASDGLAEASTSDGEPLGYERLSELLAPLDGAPADWLRALFEELRSETSTDLEDDWTGVVLNDHNNRQLWVPAGFAHGFMAMSDVAEVPYKTTAYHAPDSERSIDWMIRTSASTGQTSTSIRS